MKNNKATFLYIRLTDQESSTGRGETQGCGLAQWCTENQIKNFHFFADRGASKLSDERPAYNRMMERLKRSECSNLVVLSLDRIARSKSELAMMLESVRTHDVRFVSITDRMDTKMSLSMLTFLQALMKMEKAVIGERLLSGRKKAAAPSDQSRISL